MIILYLLSLSKANPVPIFLQLVHDEETILVGFLYLLFTQQSENNA